MRHRQDQPADASELVVRDLMERIVFPSLRVSNEEEHQAFWETHAGEFADYLRTLTTLSGVLERAQAGGDLPTASVEQSVSEVADDLAEVHGEERAHRIRRAAFTLSSALEMSVRIANAADQVDGLPEFVSDFNAGCTLFSAGFWSLIALMTGAKAGFDNAVDLACAMMAAGAKLAYASVRSLAEEITPAQQGPAPLPDDEDFMLADEDIGEAERLLGEAK